MKHRPAVPLAFGLGLILIAVLAAGCGTETPPAGTPTMPPGATAGGDPETAPTAAPETPVADPVQSPAPGADAEPEGAAPPVGAGKIGSAGEVAAAVPSRTPEPTPTPDVVAHRVEAFAAEAGLSDTTFLGLPASAWIDMAISLLIILAGYLLAVLAVRLLLAVLGRLVRRTPSGFDDAFVETIASELKWLFVVIIARYALLRLDFWSDGLRTIIGDVSFVLGTGIVALMVLKLISAAVQWYRDDLEPEKDRERLEPFLMVLQRSAYALVVIVWISIVLSHFGISVTALSAVLILVAVVISLGARDVISDAISGFIILIDQPFRVGDVIAIEELHKWGDVVDIGTRTTRIRTRDNRYVVVPNSTIGTSQVVNYTFPEGSYRVHSIIRVAYGSDFDQVRRVVEEAVRGVEGVLPDHSVDALFLQYGRSARRVQVRWWIDNMHREFYITDRVNEALEIAFDEAGIEMPVTTRELIVRQDPEADEELPRSTGEPSSPGKSAGLSGLSDEGKTGNR